MNPEPAPADPTAETIRAALVAATNRIAGHSDTPRLDAEMLMAHALHVDRGQLLLADLDVPVPGGFEALVARREADEPIAYIVGHRAFWTIDLEVGPGVLVPRPDSETLIDAAVDHFGARVPRSILDLGTGPGTLLLAALDNWWQAHGLGIDASEEALAYARRNAERLGMAARADFRLGNWAEGVEGPFDLILCNPPYVETGAVLPADVRRWEPSRALFAGADGLDDYRRLAPEIVRLLAPDGLACIELGAGQADAVAALFEAAGAATETRADLGGHRRCLLVRP
ncbi:peptide chain release factor N(5)-glutamine methyltransferase [Sphingosinicella sp. BN140058]|uniref:peptide chain release factor N(5)-glutamine methyltransferase n=1 Tax=Sphingosinicella sp. BN140058 TaxID=1892855 RepID=UPI0010137B2D|nr:peptide chain release factor N(5)-glutamine methyltransferase [Sphingosinicella sp. BN140058]QAY76720.1 peptide chain release factor N(5)-glutamine methyltransferase [Sphingosinicella sp. BN140058]